jgi:hypothetical protein
MGKTIEGEVGVADQAPGSRRSWSNDPGFSSWREFAERFAWKPLGAAMEVAVVSCILATVAVGAISVGFGQDKPTGPSQPVLSASIMSDEEGLPSEASERGCSRVKPLSRGGIHEFRA